MAGHSHWAGIKHKKAALDAKRGKVWSKIARNIIVAAKSGGGDPDANLTLRYAIDKAKAANMPKDSIEKAIKKGTGELGGVNYEEILYEGYGANGVAVMCEVLTNAFQHAFQGMQQGYVELRVTELAAGGLRIMVSDDGVGLPASIDWPNGATMGGRLISQLLEGLDATINVARGAAGTVIMIDVPVGFTDQ